MSQTTGTSNRSWSRARFGQVMDLGDGAAADDADPDGSHVFPHSPSKRLMRGATVFHRSPSAKISLYPRYTPSHS